MKRSNYEDRGNYMCCGVFIHNTTHPHANGISATITVTLKPDMK